MAKDHLIRMASRIHKRLSSQTTSIHSRWHSAAIELVDHIDFLKRHWTLARQARDRGWHATAAAEERHVLDEAARIEVAASRLVKEPLPPQSAPLTLGTIVAELKQLKDEFEDVEIDLKEGLVAVTTESIVLEGIDLGPFSIEPYVSRLGERWQNVASAFRSSVPEVRTTRWDELPVAIAKCALG